MAQRRSNVTIEGLDQLKDRLAELAPTIRAACFRALKQAAEEVVKTTERTVAVDTGNLQKSVRARYRNNQLYAEIGYWDRDDDYAALQEFGSRRRTAHPTLGPALEQERAHLPDRIKSEVRKDLP